MAAQYFRQIFGEILSSIKFYKKKKIKIAKMVLDSSNLILLSDNIA